MMTNYKNTLFKFRNIYRYFSSALYITGDKAQTTFAVLTPIIDFEKQIIHKEDLIKNVTARGLKINVDDLIKHWIFFQDIVKRKQILEITRADISQTIGKLLKCPDADPLEIEKFKIHAKMVKDDLKNLKESSYDIEEITMVKVLSLPNILHSKTPLNDENILYTHLKKPEFDSLSHMDKGTELKYIKYLDPFTCYLKSDAALFEIKLLNYFRQALLKLNYIQFSNPNFCRSVISEGCDEICHSDEKMFGIEEQHHEESNINKLRLCGSASLFSFMAYFSRHLVPQNAFPLKYFNLGKIYQPVKEKSIRSLFSLSQQTVLHIFTADLENSPDNLDILVDQISKIYDPLGIHYRIAILPARELKKAESLRISIQMYSNFEKQYVEIGNVSLYSSYLSKRLLFTYSDKKERRYPEVTSGSLLNFHKFLGCVFENSDKNVLTGFLNKLNNV